MLHPVVLWMIGFLVGTATYWLVRGSEAGRLIVYPGMVGVRLFRLRFLDRLPRSRRLHYALLVAGTASMVLSLFALYYYVLLPYVLAVASGKAAPGKGPLQPILPGLTVALETFLYMLPGLSVAIVLHELAHAVAARIEGIEVRSAGILLLLGVIFGAFVEPDEEQLREAPLSSRVVVYSAGITANFLTGLAAAAILALLAAQPAVHAVAIVGVAPSSPAAAAGIKPGSIILSVNGTRVESLDQLLHILGAGKPAEHRVCYLMLLRPPNGGSERVLVCKNPGEKYIGIYVEELVAPRSLVETLGLWGAVAVIRVVWWFFILSLSLAAVNAAPLFVTDGARVLNDVLVRVLGEKRGLAASYAIQLATLVMVLISLRI